MSTAKRFVLLRVIAFAVLYAPTLVVDAADVNVRIENLQPAGGLFFTPVWTGFHDGLFDIFNAGGMTSTELEALAEDGVTDGLSGAFSGSGVGSVIAPGSPFGPIGSSFAGTASADFSIDPAIHRYFSYASMIIPSNDAFFGNDNPVAHEIFDSNGNFAGPLTIEIQGQHIWDAGTEVNNPSGGAAFSALGGDSASESNPISAHAGLDPFLNTGTANGETITSVFSDATPIARLTITQVPEPSSGIMALSCLALFAVRRHHYGGQRS